VVPLLYTETELHDMPVGGANAEDPVDEFTGKRGTGGISSSARDVGRVALLDERPDRYLLRDRKPACESRTLDLRTAEIRFERLLLAEDSASAFTLPSPHPHALSDTWSLRMS